VLQLSTGLNVERDYPCPSDGVVLRCIRFADWDAYYDSPSWAHQYPFGSESLFSLPVDSETLYLVSRGAYQHGTVTLEQSGEVSDSVFVRIRAAYYTDEALNRTNVCRLEHGENENGIGIYVSLPSFEYHDASRANSLYYTRLRRAVFLVRITKIKSDLISHSPYPLAWAAKMLSILRNWRPRHRFSFTRSQFCRMQFYMERFRRTPRIFRSISGSVLHHAQLRASKAEAYIV
jgi:hypothetical protein